VLLGGISAGLVPTFLLGQMYAAGGNVTINADRDQLSGTGHVTAYGSPTITVVNNSNAYLILAGGAYIPDVAGGRINFTGGNGVAGTVHTSAQPGTVPGVTISNAFDDGTFTGPALIVAGAITNLGGFVSISNKLGSYGQTANLSAQQLNVYVPNGAVAVSANDPSGMYIAGGFPSTEWLQYMVLPGGHVIDANSATIAANYLANAEYMYLHGAEPTEDQLNAYLYGASNQPVDPQRFGLDRTSMVFLGSCAPYNPNCTTPTGNYSFAEGNFFQRITYYPMTVTAASFSSADLSGSQNSYQIYGGQVAIKASIININATIVAGRATDYSINLASSLADPLITTVTQTNNNNNDDWWLGNQNQTPVYVTTYSGGELALDRQNYLTALATNPGVTPIYTVSGTSGLVTYNAATNQLSVATINASSGGGNVLLDGKIVSTNTVGRIHLNGGYGNVQINNQTGRDLVLNNINTGNALAASALVSTVKIVNRLDTSGTNTTVYNYTPGVGIRIYRTNDGLDPLAGATPILVSSDTTVFNPTAGTRYEWAMQATISRTVSGLLNTASAWGFTSGSANAPWVYLQSQYIDDYKTIFSDIQATADKLTASPQGIVTTGNSTSMPAFVEKITGGVTSVQENTIFYAGCGDNVGDSCNHGFIRDLATGSNPATWNYQWVNGGWLRLNMSVKADNPIAVDFGGNASGRVNVTSNSNIIVAGTITNPSGTATLTASRGPQTVFNQTTSNITQTAAQPILTTNLSMVAADAIGTALKPINATITANSGGTINAQTGTGDIYMNLNSAAKLGLVWAGDPQDGFREVNIIAAGGLTRGAVPQDFDGSAGSDINVRARNINLTSTGGSIGSVTDPLKISANATALSGGGFDGGVVNIVANGDIGFTQVAANSNYSGDLRVGLIASNSGDVLINVPGGNIYDASGQTAAQALTAAQVEAISQALHLTPLDGAQASALATVTAFDNLMNKSIADYSRIFDKGSKQYGRFLLTAMTTEIFRPAVSAILGRAATDAEVQRWANAQFGIFVLNANAIDVFRPLVTASLGIANHTATDDEVQTWANAKYNASVPTFYRAYGVNFTSAAALTAALTNYNAYAQLAGVGSLQGSTFVLNGSGLLTYSSAAFASNPANDAKFQLLTANGSLQNGTFVLTTAGIGVVGHAVLDTQSYATLQLLQVNGIVRNGVYSLTDAGLLAVAPNALGQNYATFQRLTSSANSFMQAGVFTLTPAGVAAFQADATTALGRTATDAEVRTWASGQYQTLSGSIQTYAGSQYQMLAAQVQDYANTQYGSLAAQIQTYAGTRFTTLKSSVVYSATPSVALLLLNASGNVTNGSFVLSATGVLSYASSALSAANYNAFRSLVSNGSVQGGGTFLLNQTGLMNTAQAALTADYQSFQNLTDSANGAITNGTLVLTTAGIAAFRAAANNALGHAPSDAEVQAYANVQYQAYAATIRASANTQYQGYATTIQNSANAQYQAYAATIRAYVLSISGAGLSDASVPLWASSALTGEALAAFQSLYAKGTVTNGVFTLTATNISLAASAYLGAADYNSFQTLTALGTVTNGVFALNAAGVSSKALTVLAPTYQSFLALGANGAVQYGTYQFNNAGVATYAQAGITAGYQNFQALVTNGSLVNGVFVLTAGGIASLRPAAAAALGIANPTDAQVQSYANAQYQASLFGTANTQYQNYRQTISVGASTQYQTYLQTIRDYINDQNNGPFGGNLDPNDPNTISSYASSALGSNYQNYQRLISNGTVANFVYTLNAAGTGAIAQQVLTTADYTGYQALVAGGSVQNGAFLQSSSGAYQAFQQLAANGSFQNGTFAFTGAGIQSNAQSVLTNAFQQLTGYGSVQGNTFVLGNTGVSYYAAAALTPVNFTTYAGLTSSANGAINNGTLVLNANGLAAFRQAAAAALNISSPTDAQVQTYANAQYQAFTQTIQSYGNAQYQANAVQAQTTANTQYQTFAQTIADYIQNGQNGCSIFCNGGNGSTPPTDAQIAQNAQAALTPADYAAFQALVAKGTIANGLLTLNAAGVQSYAADTTVQGQKYTTFQALTSNGTLSSNGTFTLNASVLPTFAQAALDTASYQNYLTIRQNIGSGIQPQGADAVAYASYNQRIQTYANATYQADLQTIQGYANAQYQTYAQTIQSYGASQYNTITSQIQTYADTQYQADVSTIQAYGAAQYQTLNAAGTTPPPAGLQALVANFGWSAGQLASAIDQSAVQPATTTIGEGKANIVGRDVTLNTSGSVGTLAPNVTVDLNDLRNGTISYAQRAALAIATTPGSVTFDAIDSNGQARTGLVLSTLAPGVTVGMLTKAELRQTSPVFVNASGKFSATAGTAVYLQSTSAPQGTGATLTIGQINAGGDVNLQAPQSILAATANGNALYAVQIVTANNGNLTLAAGQNIGSAANALSFQIQGNLVAASAGTGEIYLNSTGSALNIGRVNAQGTASITSSGNIASYLPGIAITANSVVLNSLGDVGSSGSALSIKVGQGGNLSGTVSGSAYNFDQMLTDAANPAQLVRDLTVGAFSAAAGLYLTAEAGIVIATSATSANGPVTLAADSIMMNTGSQITSGGLVTLAGAGDVTLAHVESSYNPASAARVVSVTAGGDILSSDGIQTNIVANTTNALVWLEASHGIGSLTQRVSFNVTSLAATANSGDLDIGGVTSLHATSLAAVNGSIDVLGAAALQLDSVTAGGSATSTAATTNKGTTLTATNGPIGLNAGGLIDWTTLNAGTQINVRSTAGAVNLDAATSGGSQTIRGAEDVNFATLTTNGITGDVGDVGMTSDHGRVQGVTVAANGSATLTAATTNKGTILTATNGSIGLNAGGLIDWTTLNAGTQIDVRSTAGAVNLNAATSGGSQTIRGAQDVNFATLTSNGITGDVGDVGVTSDNGLIQGTTVAANGSAMLIAATTNKGTRLTASTGAIGLNAGGLIDWTTLNAGRQINVRSTAGAVNFDSVTSGGSQTIRGAQDVNFATLTTHGATGDQGDVGITSDTGLIQGVTVAANGSATLIAATTNKGTTLTASNGSATLLAGGLIDWANVNAAKSFTAISTGGAINLGTAVSGGSQTLHALDGVTFTRLTTTGIPGDQGDVSVTSDRGSIRGATVSANGDASVDGGVSIDLGTLSGGSVALSTPRDLAINFLQVYRSITLAADTINVTAEQLPSVPAVPLHVTVTGYRGGVATLANLTIDPPEVIVDSLRVTDIALAVDSPKFTVMSGYVPGQMMLTTPAGNILLDNRSPAPVGGMNLQLYQSDGIFSMQQIGNANYSDTQVVYFDTTISSTITNYGGGGAFTGSSFVRNSLQDMRSGEGFDFASIEKSGLAAFYLLGLPGGWRIDAARTPPPVEAIGEGPAVNIDGLPEARKLRQIHERKGARKQTRSSSLEQGDKSPFNLAAAAR
jgi:hypothetical protein